MSKHGLRAFGLSLLAALGLMVIVAGGAQAEFLDETGKLVTETPVVVSQHTEGILLVIPLNLEIKCPTMESDPTAQIKLLASPSAVAHGSLLFKNCKTFTRTPLEEQAKCVPKSPGLAAGEILAGGLAHMILHKGKNYVLFEPTGGLEKIFVTIEFPGTCALVETSEVKGSVIAECGELNPPNTYVGGDCATLRPTQILKEISKTLAQEISTEQKTVLDRLKFGENDALIDGLAAVKLGGTAPLAGQAWGGHI